MLNKRDLYLIRISVRNEMEHLAKTLIKDIHKLDYDEIGYDIGSLEDFNHTLKEIAHNRTF